MAFDLKNLTDKQKGGIALIAAGLVLVIVLLFLPGKGSGGVDEGPVDNAVAEVPTASDPVDNVSNNSDFKRGEDVRIGRDDTKIEEYWDNLASGGSRDAQQDAAPQGQAQQGGTASHQDTPSRKAYTSEEDFFGISDRPAPKEEPKPVQTSGGSSKAREERIAAERRAREESLKRMYAYQDSLNRARSAAPQEGATAVTLVAEAPAPAKDTLPTLAKNPTGSAKRGNVISSLDDGWDDSSLVSSLDDGASRPSQNADYPFKCIVVRETKVRSGERVAVRLMEDMVVGGLLIPKNTHLMATANIGQRLFFTISSVEIGGRIYSLGYEAYDAHDGTKGIYCPDLNAEAKRQVKSRGLTSMGTLLRGGVGSLAGEIVETGISVAQSAQGVITVTVPAGYPFYIVSSENKR